MSLSKPELRIVISGGGTGGHIFPAIAIANAMKKANEKNEILFVGALGRMEMEKVPAAGYRIEGLPISGLKRKLDLSNLLVPFKALSSLFKARRILKQFKPHVAVGVGGYASGPLLFAASMMRIPSLIQEQNSYAGVTNKLLSKSVQKICVAYEGMEKYFPAEKIILTGNPVRQDITQLEGKRAEALKHFGLSETKKTLLVIGGSLGARTVNESMDGGLKTFSDGGVQVLWQTGKHYFPRAVDAVQPYSQNGLQAFEFIQRMDLAYAAADVVISRAGASSVSELCLASKASILVPSPNVAEDHQSKNARTLVDRKAALLVKDEDAREWLVKVAMELIHSDARQAELQKNIGQLALPGSADRIAEEIYALAMK